MCDPLTIGLAVASAGLQFVGNKQAQNATKQRLNAENIRQNQMNQQQDAALDESYQAAGKLKDEGAQQEAVNNRRQAFIQALNTRPANQNYLPGMDSAPQVVADAARATGAQQDAFSQNQAGALANLTGMEDMLQNTGFMLGRTGQSIDQIARDKARSADALRAELEAARHKGAVFRGLGQLVGALSLGKVLGVGGLGGSSGAASSVGSALAGGARSVVPVI